MSLATDLTACQQRLQEAGKKASAEARKVRGLVSVEIYDELMLQLCGVAACANELKILIGTLRMIGELEQRPPEVTAERLELFQGRRAEGEEWKPGGQECPHHLLLASLHRAGDHTLDEIDLSDRVDGEEVGA